MNEKDHSLGSNSITEDQDVSLPDENELPVILRAPGSFSQLSDDPSDEPRANSFDADPSSPIDAKSLNDNTIICACRCITKSSIVEAINTGHASLPSIAHCCKAGSDCADCHDQIARLIVAYKPTSPKKPKLNKIEEMKLEKDGLDCLPDLWKHAASGNWEELTEDDKHRFKWYGVFF